MIGWNCSDSPSPGGEGLWRSGRSATGVRAQPFGNHDYLCLLTAYSSLFFVLPSFRVFVIEIFIINKDAPIIRKQI